MEADEPFLKPDLAGDPVDRLLEPPDSQRKSMDRLRSMEK